MKFCHAYDRVKPYNRKRSVHLLHCEEYDIYVYSIEYLRLKETRTKPAHFVLTAMILHKTVHEFVFPTQTPLN